MCFYGRGLSDGVSRAQDPSAPSRSAGSGASRAWRREDSSRRRRGLAAPATGSRGSSGPGARIAAGVLFTLAATLLAACGGGASAPPPPPAGAIPAGQPIGTASVSGRVLLVGPPPERAKISISESGCGHGQDQPLSETVVTNPDGSLRNALVRIKSGLGERVFAPPEPAVIDQVGCVYKPHVIAVQVNQLVTFLNSDPTLHNVHAVTRVNKAFNVGMGIQGQKVTRFFSQPEIVRVKCDVHSWMSSYIGVFESPFHAVTGDEGAFALKGLPAGTYEVEAWQETYGTLVQKITLAEGESKTIEFRFGG